MRVRAAGWPAAKPVGATLHAEALAQAVHGFVARRVQNRDDAEEVAQEALFRLYRNVHTLRAAGALEGWAMQVARNAVIDHYRRDATGPIPADPPDLPEVVVQDDAETRSDLGACLAGLMHRLPDDYREALQFADLQAWSARRGVTRAPTVRAVGNPGATAPPRPRRAAFR